MNMQNIKNRWEETFKWVFSVINHLNKKAKVKAIREWKATAHWFDTRPNKMEASCLQQMTHSVLLSHVAFSYMPFTQLAVNKHAT